MSNRKAVFFLIFASFLVYLNSLPNDFIFDDLPIIQNSFMITDASFWQLLKSYRPLRYLSLALDYRIFGMNPYGFRLMNIIYHTLAVLSLFWMLKKFSLSQTAAFVAALLFAVHSVNTDAVAYISGRRDVLMGLFYILSVGCFINFYNTISPTLCAERKDKIPVKWGYLVLSLIFLFLSVSSKEMGVTIPVIFGLYAIHRDGRILLTKRWFYISAMILLMLFSYFVFMVISGGGSALVSLDGINFHGNSPQVHYLTATTIFLHYIVLALFPLKLILDNAGYPLVHDWNFHVFFSILVMFLLTAFVWYLLVTSGRDGKGAPGTGKTKKSIAFFIAFFVITLAPVLQIIPLHEIVAIHYLYVPVMAVCAIFGIIYDSVVGDKLNNQKELSVIGKKPLAFLLILSVVFLFYSVRTVTRNLELKNTWTALRVDESWGEISFRGYFALGVRYINMKFPDKAWEYYQKSVATGYSDENQNGNIIGYYILKGDHDKALSFFAGKHLVNDYSQKAVYNIATLYMIRGDCDRVEKMITPPRDKSVVKSYKKLTECRKHNFARFDDNDMQQLYQKQLYMKEIYLEIERKPYLKTLIRSGEFEGDKLLELVHELAIVDLQSDIPEAIEYYKAEKALYLQMNRPVPDIIDQIIAALESYQYEILVEGKYTELNF